MLRAMAQGVGASERGEAPWLRARRSAPWRCAWVLAACSLALPVAAQRKQPSVLEAPPPEPDAEPDAAARDAKPKPAPAPEATKKPAPAAEPAAPAAEQGTPPPPAAEGDFAGHGAATTSPEAPQEDFENNAQVYRRPERREFSIRFDPLNWLLLGRLSVELEASLFKYLSVQLTPVFVTAQSPIAVNYSGLDDPLTQHSNGLGPLSGASLGVGVWPWGVPFKGYVFRVEFTNYGYTYRTSDAKGVIESRDFTERRVQLFIGSHSRFGAFTFAGGFGLGYELHQVDRCALSVASDGEIVGRSSDCHGKQQIALDRNAQEKADLNGPLHPVYFIARFSLGVVF